ncbi:hypothetical protein [Emticicia sp. 17c]|uniref:hypothetical protein n=1 Tax=Emticicia sp. 17c TaxID=3127704 RepID=UPI00301E28F0
MLLKGKILQTLKTRYKNLGFSEKAFEAVATWLETGITEESEIDTAIEGVEPLLKAFQGDADKRVTDAITRQKADKETDARRANLGHDEQLPLWAQELLESNRNLLAKVSVLESGKALETRRATLENLLKETPEWFRQMKLKDFDLITFKDDTEFEHYKTELEASLEEIRQQAGEQGAGRFPKPIVGRTNKGGVSADTQTYIEARKAQHDGKAAPVGKQVFSAGIEPAGVPTRTTGKSIFNS